MVHESSKCILSHSKKENVTNIKQYKLDKTKYIVVTETFKQTLFNAGSDSNLNSFSMEQSPV